LTFLIFFAVLSISYVTSVFAQEPQTEEPTITCPAGFDLVDTWREDLRADAPSSFTETFSLAQPAQVILPTWSAVGHPEAGCQPGVQDPTEGGMCDDIDQASESFSVSVDSAPLATVPDHGTDQWLFYGNVDAGTLSAGDHSVLFRHVLADVPNSGAESVIYKTGLCVAAAPPVTTTITVIKEVINDNGGLALAADFPLFLTLQGESPQSVTNNVAMPVTPGSYVASETQQGGYSASFSGDCDANGAITIAAGQNLSCTITNNDPPPEETPPPPDDDDPPPPDDDPPAPPAQVVVASVGEPTLSKSVNPPFALPGNDVTWTITVTNPTSGTFTDVRVQDTIPGEAIIQSVNSSSGSVSFSGQNVTFNQSSLGAGGRVTINVATRISDNAVPPFRITNGATLRVAETPNTYSAQATVLSIAALPAAGLSPLQAWRLPIFAGLLALTLGGIGLSSRWLRRRGKR